LTERVNDWLRRLGINYEVAARTTGDAAIGDLTTLALTDLRTKVKVSPSDVGFGISQLLPIVVQCLLGSNTIVCIEQPEIHVHPRLQTELANLLVESVQKQHNQLIVETHSEHVMLRLQNLVREGRIDSDAVGVLYVDPDPDGGATVKTLRLGTNGEFLDPWPQGFFSERFDEVFGPQRRGS
jgi:predicted ATPase